MGIQFSTCYHCTNNTWTPAVVGNAMNTFPSNINRTIVDENQVGNVFIVVFKGDVTCRKIAHHAVLIDVAGASDHKYLKGVLLHLTANPTTRISKFRFGDKHWKREMFYDIVQIAQIAPPTSINITQTRHWACHLQLMGHEVFDCITDGTANRTWSSKVNCQTFCKAFLDHMGFHWPTKLQLIEEDIAPVIIDLTSIGLSCTARSCSKKETDDSDNDADD